MAASRHARLYVYRYTGYVCLYAYTSDYVCIYIYVYVCVHQICVFICLYQIFVIVCMCVYVYVCTVYVYTRHVFIP